MSSELWRRIGFTVGALLVFRLGTHIPIPGIDSRVLAELFRGQSGGPLGMAVLFSGGAVRRVAIFSLSLMPYLTAAILLQLLSLAVRPLRALPKQGEQGRRRLDSYTLAFTIVIAIVQSFGIAFGLEGAGIAPEPGWMFRLTTVTTLTGGTVFLIWLCGQITARGVGNGLSLILLLGIILELPPVVAGALEIGQRGLLPPAVLAGIALLAIALTAVVVLMELARLRLPIAYGREVGERTFAGQSDLAIKLNGGGVIPVLLASWLLLLPIWIASFTGADSTSWLRSLVNQLSPGRPVYMLYYGLGIMVCTFFYTAFVLDPEEIAENLNKHGGTIENVAPGEATASFLDEVMSRTTLLGAAYLAFVCLVPEFLIVYADVPFYLGGTSLLLMVCAILDLKAQIPALDTRRGEPT